ncbi:MAG: DUF530 family protein [Candidatus Hydrothermarchaeaceae archaeon]
MVETSPLLNQVVDFLDGISDELRKLDLERLKEDIDYFQEIYSKFNDNLAELKAFKAEMEQRGFDSPYFALGMSKYGAMGGKQAYGREDVEDQRDVARYKMFFRANAAFKKGTFERTKSGISSHNIAVGHLDEFAAFECSSCGRVTRGKEATKLIETNNIECPKCGSHELKLKVNELGIYRMEILPHLPYGGESTLEISKFTFTERMAYRELIEVLREKKKGKIKSATVTFRVRENGRWIRKKEQVEIKRGAKLDYEGILRKTYGKIAIENIRYHHERSILVSGRYNRQALAIAYTKILKEKRESMLEYLLERTVDVEKLREYERIRERLEPRMYAAAPSAFSIDTRAAEERREAIYEFEEELKKTGLMDKFGELLPELEKAIEYRRKLRKEMLIKIPRALFAWDIFKFLLIKPYRERRYASIFPGLQPVPDFEQLRGALDILEEAEIVAAVGKFVDESVIGVSEADSIVYRKFDLEEILQDYLKVTSSRAVGGIALYLDSDLDLPTAASVVSAKRWELEEVLKVIIRLGRRDAIPEEKLKDLEEIRGALTQLEEGIDIIHGKGPNEETAAGLRAQESALLQ